MRLAALLLGTLLTCSQNIAFEHARMPPAETERSRSKFPLQVSKDRRYLVDQDNRPFLVVGDTPWSIIADLKEADIKTYLDDRRKRGFNSILVNLLEHKFATDPPRTRAGLEPFIKAGDFSNPNAKYFDFARNVISWANERGISVWLCPAYLGWGGGDEGFFQKIKVGGADKLTAYGKFVGERFKDLPNIVWVIGGDYAVPKEHAWAITDLAESIRAGGAKQLMTIHGGQQSAVDVVGDKDWLDVNTTYSYEKELFRMYRKDYERKTVRPFVLIESVYENEHESRSEQIRRQAYWAMTGGACGQFFGNNPIWHFDGPGLEKAPRGWRDELDGTGSRDMARLRTAFVDRPWHKLVPDFKNSIVTKGVGDGIGTISTSATADGKLAMVYIPSTGVEQREFTVDMTCFPGPITATWFNPTDGKYTPVADKAMPNKATLVFRTPGNNGTKTNDWLLILETNR
jgi:hypothetical protein